jgi:16S rRNA (cytosine967-C5)-methyltransferase
MNQRKAESSPGRAPARPATARSLAARVLERVDENAAYAAAALDAELDRHPSLDPRDRGLTAELVYGVLRTRGAIQKRILEHAPRGVSDRLVARHLDLAAYQLLLLDRVPAWAAVDETVAEIRRARGGRVAGFANAVLRRVAEGPKLELASAVRESAPGWLLERLTSAVGQSEAEALLGSDIPLGRSFARLVSGRTAPEWFETAEAHPLWPFARVLPGGDPEKLPGFAEGAFVVQELGAQLVGLALGVRAGERVLDACAGRGQKTSLLAEQIGAEGELWAADAHPEKLANLTRELARLRLSPVKTAPVDWTLGPGDVPGGFDRVLVDAPCTGVGTLRRRPEIARRLGPEDPARLGALALAILRGAARQARPGGRVVFAVCSVFAEEAERVVEQVQDLLDPVPFDAPALAPLVGENTSLRLLPRAHGTDGYFVASFARR